MEARTTRNPEQTRSTLLEAAFKEMYEHGFQAASLERILANTNVTKGALYHHFPNKQRLGIAVLREVIAQKIREAHAPLLDCDDPIPVLLRMLDERLACMEPGDLKCGCPLNNLIQEMSPLNEEFRSNLQEIQFGWQRSISHALEKGQAKGNVRADLDSDEAAMFIFAAIEGCVGASKTLNSLQALRGCVNQLKGYIKSLAP